MASYLEDSHGLEYALDKIGEQLSGAGVDRRRVEKLMGCFVGESISMTIPKAECVADMLKEVAAATKKRIRESTLAEIRKRLEEASELCELKEPSDTEIETDEQEDRPVK